MNNIIKTAEESQAKKLREKIKEPELIEKSTHITNNAIYEQVNNQGKNYFIKYNRITKQIQKEPIHEIPTTDGTIIIPIQGEEIEKGVVILPSEPLEYETTEKLDQEIQEHIYKWLDVDDTYRRFATWNIRFSWLYDKFETLNYLRALGDTGNGKSRFLNVLGNISYKPMKIAGALTPAVIFRMIDKWEGTLLIDEGDQKDSDEANAFIKILNCGYEKGMSVLRVDTENKNKINFYKVYCPKVITTRRRFTDKATEARCMTKIMIQTRRTDIPDILTKQYYEETKILRNKLLTYRLKNYDLIDPEAGLKVDLSMYEPRLRQVNRGFIGLFSTNKDEVENFKQYLNEYQKTIIQERSESYDGGIVLSIADLICADVKVITPQLVAEQANREYASKYEATSRSVGQKARAMGLDFKPKKVNGKTFKVLNDDKELLSVLFSRYIFDDFVLENLQKKGYEVTTVTVPIRISTERNQAKNQADLSTVTNVTDVTNVTQNLLNWIKKNGKNNEIFTQKLIDFGFKEEQINKAIENGNIFEPRSGVVKIVD